MPKSIHTSAPRDHRRELEALQASLDAWAMAMTHNAHEAADLVCDTLAAAGEVGCAPAVGESTQAWIHGLLRRRFHSVERARLHSRSRSAEVTALNEINLRARRARLAEEQAARQS